MPTTRRITTFLRALYDEIENDNVFNGAAALGFYLTLAIFPTMIFLMALIPYLPVPRVDQAIMDLLRQAMPPSAASMFSDVVSDVASVKRAGLLSFGLVGAVWAASTGMVAIMRCLLALVALVVIYLDPSQAVWVERTYASLIVYAVYSAILCTGSLHRV